MTSATEYWANKCVEQDAEIVRAVIAERERCLKVIEDLRISEAGNFKDPKCQGQRGADRLDALYDAYQAVKNGDRT